MGKKQKILILYYHHINIQPRNQQNHDKPFFFLTPFWPFSNDLIKAETKEFSIEMIEHFG